MAAATASRVRIASGVVIAERSLRLVLDRCRSAAAPPTSGRPSASAATAGGHGPTQLSRTPSTVSTVPETKSAAGEAR